MAVRWMHQDPDRPVQNDWMKFFQDCEFQKRIKNFTFLTIKLNSLLAIIGVFAKKCSRKTSTPPLKVHNVGFNLPFKIVY